MLLGLPATIRVCYGFILAMLAWMVLWSFGVSGVVSSGMDDGARWWILLVSDFRNCCWVQPNTTYCCVHAVYYLYRGLRFSNLD